MDIIIGIVAASLYFILGIGTARLISSWHKRDLKFLDVFAWPIALCVFAICGDVA